MKIKLALLTILNLFVLLGKGQELKIGDHLPTTIFKEVWNHSSDQVDLRDYRGKYVILDFWGTRCAPCLEGFVFVQEIQDAFQNDIQFLAVNKGLDVDSVDRFFKQRKHITTAKIPYITNDTLLNSYFPHQGMPFYVILDREGKLLKTVDRLNKDKGNFDKLLRNDLSGFEREVKKNYIPSLFESKWDSLPIFASYIFNNTISSGARIVIKNMHGKEFSETGTISFLYQRAYENYFPTVDVFRPGRLILEVSDQSKYIKPENLSNMDAAKWVDNNLYTYVSRIPHSDIRDLKQLMREDLERYFRLKVSVEKRLVPHLVLRRNERQFQLKTKGGKTENSFMMTETRSETLPEWRKLVNQPFASLSDYFKTISEYKFKTPFLDLTGIRDYIDFKIKGNVLDNISIADMQSVLEPAGLALTEEMVEIDILILKE